MDAPELLAGAEKRIAGHRTAEAELVFVDGEGGPLGASRPACASSGTSSGSGRMPSSAAGSRTPGSLRPAPPAPD